MNSNINNQLKAFNITIKGDRIIWIIVFSLFFISILSVFSSSSSLAYQKYGGMTISVLIKHCTYLLFSLGIIYIAHNINYTFFKKYANTFFIFSIFLLLYTIFFGVEINGAVRWIRIPLLNITVQTSEIAILSLFIYLAKIISKNQKNIKNLKKGFLSTVIPTMLIVLLIFGQKFSSSIMIMVSGFVIMIIGRVNLKHIFLFLLIFFCIGLSAFLFFYNLRKEHPKTYAYTTQTFHLKRLNIIFNRIEDFNKKDIKNKQYQRIQADMAIAKGGWVGVGPGKGTLKNFLPQAYNDYIYCTIIEEYGLLGGLIIILLYLTLLYRSINLFRLCPYAFGSLLSLALSFYLSIQALIHIAVNVGLLPVTGITLPLISLGGTSFVFNSFAVGIILSVSRFVEKMENNNQTSSEENKLPAHLSSIIFGIEEKQKQIIT